MVGASVGIDFGTSNIYVAEYNIGILTLQSNASGGKRNPNFVVVEDGEFIFSEEARSYSTIELPSSVFAVQQFLGITFDAAEHLMKSQLYPFKLTSKPCLRFDLSNECYLSPSDLIRKILERIRQQCTEKLKESVEKCVITVPTAWNPERREQLVLAAQLSGFKEVHLIGDQVAGILGNLLCSPDIKHFCKNVITVDIGATSINTTVFITDSNGISSSNVTKLCSSQAGNAMDLAVLRHCQSNFKQTHGLDLSKDMKAIHRLRLACEDAKLRMASAKYTLISLPNLYEGKDFNFRLDQETFENISQPFAEAVVNAIREALLETALSAVNDYQIILLGGGSRLPAIRRLVSYHFEGNFSMNGLLPPEDAAAYGAAGFAKLLDLAPELGNVDLAIHFRPLVEIFRQNDVKEENLISTQLASYASKNLLVKTSWPPILHTGTPWPKLQYDQEPLSAGASDVNPNAHYWKVPTPFSYLRSNHFDNFKRQLESARGKPFSDDHLKQASMIQQELVQTEIEYISSLKYILDNYLPEISAENVPQSLRSKGNILFGNLPKIIEFHSTKFLHAILTCENSPLLVGQVFLNFEIQFFLYSRYNHNKPKSDQLMEEGGIAYFKAKQDKLKDNLDLASYLIKPTQRLGKYALFLEQFIKNCPPDAPELENLKKAETMVKFQLRHGNDLLAMKLLQGCDFLNLRTQGKLHRQSSMKVSKSGRVRSWHAFLFEELILFGKQKRDKKGCEIFQYKISHKTSDLGLTQQLGDSLTTFEIWLKKSNTIERYAIETDSETERHAWVKDISSILWRQAAAAREALVAEMNEFTC